MSQTANGPGSRGKYDTTKRTTKKRPAAAQDDEPGCQDAARKSRSRDTGAATNTTSGGDGVGRLAIPITFALLAVVLGLALEIVANAPTPRKGGTITKHAYAVDLERLRTSREQKWVAGAAVHAAADRLAAGTFVQSSSDGALARFLDDSVAASATWQGRVVMYAKRHLFWALQRYLGWSRTDASGFVQKASLYVASEEQLRGVAANFTATDDDDDDFDGPRTLLDVGSGTGTETVKVSAALGVDAERVVCLENSEPHRATLEGRGFRTAGSPAEIGDEQFSAATLLNVLDRCDEPGQLLDTAVRMVEPGGLLLLATVLPFSGHVYEGRFLMPWGRIASRHPRSPLAIHRRVDAATNKKQPSFEASAAVYLEAILRRHPQLELEGWTRLPYVSSGDGRRTHYTLDMALMALRVPAGDGTGGNEGEGQHEQEQEQAQEQEQEQEQGQQASGGGSEQTHPPPLPPACRERGGDKIFSWLADTAAAEGLGPWGSVLDAGGGLSSLCWLMRQDYGKIVEVTAKADGIDAHGSRLHAALAAVPEDAVQVVMGNWRDDAFLRDRRFDVVVADYLLGATEAHWPYGADKLMDRLLGAVRPGGFLLLVGLEPYELVLDRAAEGTQDRLVLDIEAVGDSAAALAGESTYRELPEAWVRHQVDRRQPDGFRVVAAKRFPMRLTARSLGKQISYARKMTAKIDDLTLQAAYKRRIRTLELALDGFGTHTGARNYAVVVQHELQTEQEASFYG